MCRESWELPALPGGRERTIYLGPWTVCKQQEIRMALGIAHMKIAPTKKKERERAGGNVVIDGRKKIGRGQIMQTLLGDDKEYILKPMGNHGKV